MRLSNSGDSWNKVGDSVLLIELKANAVGNDKKNKDEEKCAKRHEKRRIVGFFGLYVSGVWSKMYFSYETSTAKVELFPIDLGLLLKYVVIFFDILLFATWFPYISGISNALPSFRYLQANY